MKDIMVCREKRTNKCAGTRKQMQLLASINCVQCWNSSELCLFPMGQCSPIWNKIAFHMKYEGSVRITMFKCRIHLLRQYEGRRIWINIIIHRHGCKLCSFPQMLARQFCLISRSLCNIFLLWPPTYNRIYQIMRWASKQLILVI